MRVDDLLGRPIALVVALALVSLLPFVFMGTTAFVKISTVLQIVRGAIGANSVPSNTVIMALATALTLIAMAPVGQRIVDKALPVLSNEKAAGRPDKDARIDRETTVLVERGVDAVREPMRDFLKANASSKERARFLEVARRARPAPERDKVGEADLSVLVPAFVVTELTEAFAIGFLLYLPFLVIDLVVSSVLLSMGMFMLPPVMISMPLKLLLFVLADGWTLVVQNLVRSFH